MRVDLNLLGEITLFDTIMLTLGMPGGMLHSCSTGNVGVFHS